MISYNKPGIESYGNIKIVLDFYSERLSEIILVTLHFAWQIQLQYKRMYGSKQQFKNSTLKRQKQNFRNLLKYANRKRKLGMFNDVTIRVGHQRFPANRLILSCFSPYFEKMFTTSMKERYEDTVQVKGVSERSMNTLIEFIYTRNLNLDTTNVAEIIAASDFLQIDEAKNICFSFLSSTISVENCLEVFKLANMFASKSLADKTIQLLSKNFLLISQGSDFKSLSKTELESFISNLNRRAVEESCLFEAMMRWIKEEDDRKEHLLQFLKLLDLNKISSQFLEDTVLNESLIVENLQCSNMVMKILLKKMKTKVSSFPLSKMLCLGSHKSPDKVFLINSELEKKTFPCLPEKQDYLRAVKFCNYIFCISGYYVGQECCLKLDSEKMNWEKIASLRSCAPFAGTAVFRDKIVVAGGGDHVNSVDCYDPSSNKWTSLSPMNQDRFFRSELVACKGSLYALGGGTKVQGSLSSVEMLNELAGKWKVVQPMQTPRVDFAAVNYRNCIYAIGGRTAGDSKSKSVEMFETEAKKWTYVSCLNLGRRDHAACVVQDKIYVIGGLGENGQAVKEIECYDAACNKWTIVGETEEELYNHCVLAI